MSELELSSFEAAGQSRPSERRILLGFAVQPFVTALLGSVFLPILALTDPRLQRSSAPVIELALASGALVGVAGLLITICAAAPVFHWLRARGAVTWWHAAVSALLFANLPTSLLVGLIFVSGKQDSRLVAADSAMIVVRVVLLSSGIGVASAGIFWWIAAGGKSRLRPHE